MDKMIQLNEILGFTPKEVFIGESIFVSGQNSFLVLCSGEIFLHHPPVASFFFVKPLTFFSSPSVPDRKLLFLDLVFHTLQKDSVKSRVIKVQTNENWGAASIQF